MFSSPWSGFDSRSGTRRQPLERCTNKCTLSAETKPGKWGGLSQEGNETCVRIKICGAAVAILNGSSQIKNIKKLDLYTRVKTWMAKKSLHISKMGQWQKQLSFVMSYKHYAQEKKKHWDSDCRFRKGTTTVLQDLREQIYLKWKRISQQGHAEEKKNP